MGRMYISSAISSYPSDSFSIVCRVFEGFLGGTGLGRGEFLLLSEGPCFQSSRRMPRVGSLS